MKIFEYPVKNTLTLSVADGAKGLSILKRLAAVERASGSAGLWGHRLCAVLELTGIRIQTEIKEWGW